MNTNYQTTVRSSPTPAAGAGANPTAMTANPSQPSNLTNNVGSKTQNYFNNFFVKTSAISVQANDAIVSYFETQTGDAASARILAQAVINTAAQQKDDPMQVLDEFRKMPQGELNGFLALYLNASRVNTSLLGVKQPTAPNKYIARTILP